MEQHEQGPMHTEDLQVDDPPMSIPGMLILDAVVGELNIGLLWCWFSWP